MNKIKNISLIGSGNVATHLGIALYKKGINVHQIYSKHFHNAQELAAKLQAQPVNSIEEMTDVDLIIVAVNDDAVGEVIEQSKHFTAMVHTSGSLSMDVFKGKINTYGIFYPLQTFTKNINVDWNEIPFLIESNNKDFETALMHLAGLLSNVVLRMDSQKRKYIHTAAVFSCNFSNYMNIISEKILKAKGIDFSILHPLIKETLHKMITIGPENSQTGPAIRKDEKVIKEHLQLLKNMDNNFAEIYKLLTENIQKHFEE